MPSRSEPSTVTSQAMLIAVLNRLSGDENFMPSASAPVFLDVPRDAWYANAVSWAVQLGIADGTGENRFQPDAPITREQLVIMLWRYVGCLKSAGSLDTYSDADAVGGFAVDAMRWAVENGMISGKAGARLDPGGKATRAEVAVILMRFAG